MPINKRNCTTSEIEISSVGSNDNFALHFTYVRHSDQCLAVKCTCIEIDSAVARYLIRLIINVLSGFAKKSRN